MSRHEAGRGRLFEVAGLITSANLAVMSAWSEGKPIVGRHVSGRNPAPPVLSWLGLGLGLGLGLARAAGVVLGGKCV